MQNNSANSNSNPKKRGRPIKPIPYDIEIMTPSLRYYYRHRQQRLEYQKSYYYNQQEQIQRIYTNRLIHINRCVDLATLNYEISKGRLEGITHHLNIEEYNKFFNHVHGRPKGEREYEVDDKGDVELHVQPCLINTTQLTHSLGFNLGDSISWVEEDDDDRKQTHYVYFDRSGIDVKYRGDLEKMINLRLDMGYKGKDLVRAYVALYGNGTLHLWRGNKKLWN